MSSRNRGRPPHGANDPNDERSIWNLCRDTARRTDSLLADHNTKWKRMLEIKDTLESQHATGTDPSSTLEDELGKLVRDNIRLCETIIGSLGGPSDSGVNSLLDSLGVLTALRDSSEKDDVSISQAQPTRGQTKASRNAKRKSAAAAVAASVSISQADSVSVLSSAEDRDSVAADSPAPHVGPSSKVVPSGTRLKLHASGGSRAGSAVPSVREASVKIEDVESGVDGGGGTRERPKFPRGTEVFYRNRKPTGTKSQAFNPDKDDTGEGILCKVVNIISDGKSSRRYEIQDVDDPDTMDVTPGTSGPAAAPAGAGGVHAASSNASSGTASGTAPGPMDVDEKRIYRVHPNQMIAIPSSNDGLQDLLKGKIVLAMYPQTTTFYRAEVTNGRVSAAQGTVMLRFEGEEDLKMQTEVERRYVIPDWAGR